MGVSLSVGSAAAGNPGRSSARHRTPATSWLRPTLTGVVDVSDDTFTNSGTITVTSGSFEVGRPTGVVPAGGILDNLGTVDVAGGHIVTGGPSLFQNEGLLTGSSGQVVDLPIVSLTGSTIESTGTFSLPGPVTVLTDATDSRHFGFHAEFQHFGRSFPSTAAARPGMEISTFRAAG